MAKSILKCGMKLLIHSETSTATTSMFRSWYVISPTLYWACEYLSMLGFNIIHISESGHRWNVWNSINLYIMDNVVMSVSEAEILWNSFLLISGTPVKCCWYHWSVWVWAHDGTDSIKPFPSLYYDRNIPMAHHSAQKPTTICTWEILGS